MNKPTIGIAALMTDKQEPNSAEKVPSKRGSRAGSMKEPNSKFLQMSDKAAIDEHLSENDS